MKDQKIIPITPRVLYGFHDALMSAAQHPLHPRISYAIGRNLRFVSQELRKVGPLIRDIMEKHGAKKTEGTDFYATTTDAQGNKRPVFSMQESEDAYLRDVELFDSTHQISLPLYMVPSSMFNTMDMAFPASLMLSLEPMLTFDDEEPKNTDTDAVHEEHDTAPDKADPVGNHLRVE